MSFQGRVHKLSDLAIEISKRIVEGVPKERLYKSRRTAKPSWPIEGKKQPIIIEGPRRPVWMRLQFQDTQEERLYLKKAAEEYDAKADLDDRLSAHGTQDAAHLSQILLDGELKHLDSIENYGGLAVGAGNTPYGGYWDHGWGVFVIKTSVLRDAKVEGKFRILPLNQFEAILLPTPIVETVRKEFPKYEHLIKGYRQFADEFKQKL